MTPSKVLLVFLLAFLAGIFLHSFWHLELRGILGIALAGTWVFALSLAKRGWGRALPFLFFLLSAGLALGMARHEAALHRPVIVQEKDAVFRGVVVRDPEERPSSTRLIVEPERGAGLVLVDASLYGEYRYGDVVEVAGDVAPPQPFEDFDYPAFLAKEGVYAVVWRAEAEVLERGQGNQALSMVLRGKAALREVVARYFTPPKSTVLASLVLGDKHLIEEELGEQLNRAGVRHITAISGMHVMLLGTVLIRAFGIAGVFRRKAIIAAFAVLLVFVALTGFQVSAIRAAVMGGAYYGSEFFGRPRAALRALVVAAAGMLWFNPLLLAHDIGFQLSFSAVLGIILLLPWLLRKLAWVPSFLDLRTVAGMTIAAQLFTFPLLVWNFGVFSIVSVVSNLLIVPLLAYLLSIGLLFLILGAFLGPLTLPLALLLSFLLTYVMGVVELASALPFAALPSSSVFLWLFAAAALSAFAVLFWRDRKLY